MYYCDIITETSELQLSTFYKDAQFLAQPEGVCVGQEVVVACLQPTGTTIRWTINLPNITLENSTSSPQTEAELTFVDDPGFEFEIHNFFLSSIIISELLVTAVRQLNGVTVECLGGNGNFTTTIQIVSVGKCSNRT